MSCTIYTQAGVVEPNFPAILTVEKLGEATTSNDVQAIAVQPAVFYSINDVAATRGNAPWPRVIALEAVTAPARFTFSRGPNSSAISTFATVPAAVTNVAGASANIYKAVLEAPGTREFPALQEGQTIEVRDVSAANAVIWTAVVKGDQWDGTTYLYTIFRAVAAPTTTITTSDTIFNMTPSGASPSTGIRISHLATDPTLMCVPGWATHVLVVRVGSTDTTVVAHATSAPPTSS